MAISTNSIIHYTDTLENIKGILAEGFKLKYCLENVKVKGDNDLSGAYPMICFCDIPLSETKKHLDSYGYYGLGLSKKWAVSKGLNPVLYIDKASDLGEMLHRHIVSGIRKKENNEFEVRSALDFIKICSFLKNYEGDFIKAGKSFENYRFYDEREWRYVPTYESIAPISDVILTEDYINDKEIHNNEIGGIRIPFEFSDISYVIVKKEEEIAAITKLLRNIYSDKCTATELEILLTKIVTAYQIINDF